MPSGSEFSVDLDAARARTQAPPTVPALAAAQPRGEGRARTILYVEDNPSNVKLVEYIVSLRPEVTLVVAMHGSAGIDLARERSPCLILLDLNLPDLPGEEVLRQLKGDPRTADTPVIVISADAMPGQSERLQAGGAAGYLTKPFDVPRLLEIIDESGRDDDAPRAFRAIGTD